MASPKRHFNWFFWFGRKWSGDNLSTENYENYSIKVLYWPQIIIWENLVIVSFECYWLRHVSTTIAATSEAGKILDFDDFL